MWYYYLDADGNLRGPFTNSVMLDWYKRNLFSRDLTVFEYEERSHFGARTTLRDLVQKNGEYNPFYDRAQNGTNNLSSTFADNNGSSNDARGLLSNDSDSLTNPNATASRTERSNMSSKYCDDDLQSEYSYHTAHDEIEDQDRASSQEDVASSFASCSVSGDVTWGGRIRAERGTWSRRPFNARRKQHNLNNRIQLSKSSSTTSSRSGSPAPSKPFLPFTRTTGQEQSGETVKIADVAEVVSKFRSRDDYSTVVEDVTCKHMNSLNSGCMVCSHRCFMNFDSYLTHLLLPRHYNRAASDGIYWRKSDLNQLLELLDPPSR